MPNFAFDVTIPINTSKNTPQVNTLELIKGVIHQIEVDIPDGVASLAGIALFHGEQQIFPTNPGSFYSGNDRLITFKEHFKLDDAPFSFRAHSFNDDSENPHTLTVRISILDEEILLPQITFRQLLTSLIDVIRRIFGTP